MKSIQVSTLLLGMLLTASASSFSVPTDTQLLVGSSLVMTSSFIGTNVLPHKSTCVTRVSSLAVLFMSGKLVATKAADAGMNLFEKSSAFKKLVAKPQENKKYQVLRRCAIESTGAAGGLASLVLALHGVGKKKTK